jgi:hypothetical protein
MLYYTTAMQKSLLSAFSFSEKLISARSVNFTMALPIENRTPAYVQMDTFTRSAQKLVIKDMIQYTDRKIVSTKTATKR